MWYPEDDATYFALIQEYRDVIALELAGHDHYADVRHGVGLDADGDEFNFHNLIIIPGVTPNHDQNPGVALLEIDGDVPKNMKMEFLDLEDTIGLTDIPAYEDLTFRSLDLKKDFGLKDLTPDGMSEFTASLEADWEVSIEYALAKLGFDESIALEREWGILQY